MREFASVTAALVGMPVSRAWRGGGSAIGLELGALGSAPPDGWGPDGAPPEPDRGEASVLIQWSWRVERPRSIEVGSWSTEARIDAGVARLAGPTVTGLGVDGALPELTIGLSDGRRLRSFMTAEGQPAWTVFLRDGSWVTVERGRLVHDTQNQRRPAPGG